MNNIQLTVNGELRAVACPPNMPLLWVLRDLLQLTGTKYGCGIGQCGACTVLLEGRATRSCLLTAEQAHRKSITTIEGLAQTPMKSLQEAWKEENVPQCGYCQSGQLMSAAGLIKNIPKPSDSQIRSAMSGNLCRCGTYPRVFKAIQHVIENS